MIRIPDFAPDKLVRGLIRPHRAIGGFLSNREAVQLFRLANRLPDDAVVVEIGSWLGKSTYCLAAGLRSGFVHVIDPFDASGEPGSRETYLQARGERPLLDQFKQNLAPFSKKIRIRRGFSREFSGDFTAIDLLMIDGDHSREGCDYDLTTFGPRVRESGFLAFHDYDPSRPEFGPTWVIENRVKTDPRFKEFARADSLWVAQRRPIA